MEETNLKPQNLVRACHRGECVFVCVCVCVVWALLVYVCLQFRFFTNPQKWQCITTSCRVLPYLHHIMLINVKLDISFYKRIAFQV